MERWQKITIAVLAGTVAALAIFSAGFSLGSGRRASYLPVLQDRETSDGLELIEDAYGKIVSSSIDPPSEEDLARGAIKGMVETLRHSTDPYALFYSPDGFRSFQELTTGRFSGIGVWLKEKEGDLEIVSVLPSTPAKTSGLQPGDVITTIDDLPVEEMTTDEAVARIKGREGTTVSIGVQRGELPLEFAITRAAIDLPNLKASVVDGLGYVRLFGFARGAGEQLRDEVDRLVGAGADGIVLDLRDNGGGLFSEAVDVASLFIEDGDIVIYREQSDDEVAYDAEGDAFEDLPLVVLVNEGTASASEIVAGALQDRDRALVVGETTYGKGSVQRVVMLSDYSALKLTTAAYLTPSGDDINGDGIDPDVEVAGSPAKQRERAVEILKGIVISSTGAQG